jgi:hypothetical protein
LPATRGAHRLETCAPAPADPRLSHIFWAADNLPGPRRKIGLDAAAPKQDLGAAAPEQGFGRMNALIVLLITVLLVSGTVLIHYEALRLTGRLIARTSILPRQRIMVVIGGCFAAHLAEIALYALAYALLHEREGFGGIEGEFGGTMLDFFYFSITSYTTLGIGDVYPKGLVRIVSGVEALNGFLLITWSASFTYLMMQQYWHPEDDR